LNEINPRLVYCAISGFGQTGPMRDTRAYDQIIQGLSGVMAVTGDPASGPTRAGFPVCDIVGGLTAAFAISGALHRRAAVGTGDFLDVSMLDASITMLGWAASNWLIAGVEPQLLGNENMTSAPSGAFKTADGLLNIAANEQGQFVALCRLVGHPEIATDPRFAKRDARKRNREALNDLIETHLMTRPAIEWERACHEAGVPAGRILSVPDALKNPQIVHRKMTRDFTQVPGVDRPITVVAAGFKAQSNDEPVLAPPPGLGQHTDEVLGDLGLSAAEISSLHAEGAI
jgi:crotonobetainyl-CoA:carnitine CoA-transferase CaiB-like acyl-CoA transferase